MIFEWNPEKAKSNLAKHRVSFEEASTVFGDTFSETFDDPDHSDNEQRFIIIGHSESGIQKMEDCFLFRTRMMVK